MELKNRVGVKMWTEIMDKNSIMLHYETQRKMAKKTHNLFPVWTEAHE